MHDVARAIPARCSRGSSPELHHALATSSTSLRPNLRQGAACLHRHRRFAVGARHRRGPSNLSRRIRAGQRGSYGPAAAVAPKRSKRFRRFCASPTVQGALVAILARQESRLRRLRAVHARHADARLESHEAHHRSRREARLLPRRAGVGFFDLFDYLQQHKIKLWMSIPANGWGSVIGNALDRGLSYTPYGEHSSAMCGMEVVFPNGDSCVPASARCRAAPRGN